LSSSKETSASPSSPPWWTIQSELDEHAEIDAWNFILDGWEAGFDLSDVDPTDPDVQIEVSLIE
jgi:hypothetical protein